MKTPTSTDTGSGRKLARMLPRLLTETDPAIAALARRDLIGEPFDTSAATESLLVARLLTGQRDDGGFGTPHYAKWRGAHWRLVSLVELGIPAGHPAATHAADAVLAGWAGRRRLAGVPIIDGRARRCASQEGNAVAVACRLGFARDDRVTTLAAHLVRWQWPDGGWNCDRRPAAHRSSFHETLPALWGLHEYTAATGDPAAAAAAARAAELLLSHRVFRRLGTVGPLNRTVTVPHWPPYWHYDALQAMVVLTRAGYGDDPRTADARALLASQRRPDGTWHAGRPWWRPPGSPGSNVEAVDWGESMHAMVTLNALRVGCGNGG